ncbi:F-actin-capping protein subunit beta [Friedmanniomyces endolithicus]|nr:F-actin-capping protein subunit beta [Friedmanniomyces endolithicus]
MDPFDAALDLLRRLPPSSTQQNLNGIIALRPDLEEDLLSSVDVALTSKRCPKTGRDFLCCDYNREDSSYRSPWSNEFEPPIEAEAAADLIPGGRIRRMEESLNAGVDVYRELYYEGGISSAYLWALEEGFAGVVLFKKTSSAGGSAGKGGWDSIHVLEVSEAAGKRSAHYKLTSTVILDLGLSSSTVDSLELAGNLTRQTESDLALTHSGSRESDIEQSHVVNIGRMVEDMETRMRNLLQEVYFGKAKDVVGDLRSIQPLSEVGRERDAHKEVIKPQRGPTRHQRSAQISQEVRALNRDLSSAAPSRPQNNSAAFTDGPSGNGELASPGRMGENTSVGREGPYNQSAGETGAKEPSQDREAILREPASRTEMAAASTPTNFQSQIAETSVKPTTSTRKGPRIQPPGAPYHPIQPTIADLLISGSNSSTIAAHNFAGVLADRLTTVTEPGPTPGAGDRDIATLASKLIDGRITRLQSQKEQEAVRAEVEETMGYFVDLTPQEIADKKERLAGYYTEGAAEKRGHNFFQPLPEQVRKSLVDTTVKGVYDDRNVLPGDMYKQQPVLNTIAQATMSNSTYLHGDGERLLQKVRSLLPSPASRKKTGAAAGGAAPKRALK